MIEKIKLNRKKEPLAEQYGFNNITKQKALYYFDTIFEKKR